MLRILILALLLLALFFGVYGALRKVDWMGLFEVERHVDKTEKKVGELLWKVFQKSDIELQDPQIVQSLDSILVRLCDANGFRREEIKLHILEKDEVNAFALPDGHMVVYSGLITNSENPEELAGVMAHELAHISLDHVMKRLVKDVGLSVLISSATGSGGGELTKELARMLSSSAFDRKQEKEADLTAVDYMIRAEIDPEPFGEFLYRLGGKSASYSQYFSWISTHPDSRERGAYIVEHSKGKSYHREPVLAGNNWNQMLRKLGRDKSSELK